MIFILILHRLKKNHLKEKSHGGVGILGESQQWCCVWRGKETTARNQHEGLTSAHITTTVATTSPSGFLLCFSFIFASVFVGDFFIRTRMTNSFLNVFCLERKLRLIFYFFLRKRLRLIVELQNGVFVYTHILG